ncbi:hypothetical protein P5F75_15190 [Caldifermentibacillus hisashii]|uniref:hypothetical protein n=1 Tax=Caldifermentibacillus hisashii TaxID=996558 RepID=UPI002E2220AB|nr:hypothetical protein [Caldibacillus thermoamylovorans]MED3644711.1 hypothetical protein [Caldifermentibacillus hisashii]
MQDNIFITLKSISGDVVLSQGGYGFQSVIDDFEKASYINIVTYSIRPFEDSELLSIIKKIPYSVPVNIVLNIPKKSYNSSDASKQVYWYLRTIERQKFNDLNVYFNFSNHAKLIMTNNKAYIGSQNFSDASSDKVELGIIVKGASDVERINKEIFETIRSNSIRYATSDYVIKMEEIQGIMDGVLENLRYDIFTIAGDPPYTPEIEIFDINRAHFPKEEWSKFKDLDESLFDIIDIISVEYEGVFNNNRAEFLKVELQTHLKTFISKVDKFAEYLYSWESRVFDRFYEVDDGDTDSTMNYVLGNLEEEKAEKFEHLNGEELLNNFDQIKPIIESILDLVEEIKYEMLKRTVYENQEQIED